MNLLWETIGNKPNKIRFRQAISFSPYSEFVNSGITDQKDGTIRVELNAFYRYDDVVNPVLSDNSITTQQKEFLFDILMHYLTSISYRSGITVREAEVRRLFHLLETGDYGKDIQAAFGLLSDRDKYKISHSLYRQGITQASVAIFSETLIEVMKSGIVYKNELNDKELFYYIPEKKNDLLSNRIDAMKQLFLPLDYSLRVFWDYHFAVLGEAQTMRADEIELI